MIFAIISLFILYFLWVLFVKGDLFRIILFFAGWFGLSLGMKLFIPGSDQIMMTIINHHFSWAEVIPTLICAMCLLTTHRN